MFQPRRQAAEISGGQPGRAGRAVGHKRPAVPFLKESPCGRPRLFAAGEAGAGREKPTEPSGLPTLSQTQQAKNVSCCPPFLPRRAMSEYPVHSRKYVNHLPLGPICICSSGTQGSALIGHPSIRRKMAETENCRPQKIDPAMIDFLVGRRRSDPRSGQLPFRRKTRGDRIGP